jgi:hypothetical protein
MMFLSAGEQHHEDTWRDWFRDAGGLVPRENLQVPRHLQQANSGAHNVEQTGNTMAHG